MARTLPGAVLQFPVRMDVAANLNALRRLLAQTPQGAIAVAPEGALSGYLPEPGFVARIDRAATRAALEAAHAEARARKVHLIAGACIFEDGVWRNASYVLAPDGPPRRYDKINLARSEQGDFTPGERLPVFALATAPPVALGVQMCRELRHPEQWRVLAERGAAVFAFTNNAIASADGAAVWRAHLVSRAAETQRFVLAANNAAPDQKCPSLIAAPSGAVLAELPIGAEAVAHAPLDLDAVSDWVLAQARRDLIAVRALDEGA